MGTPRIQRLAAAMEAENVDAMLLSGAETMGYAHGFFEHGHERFLSLVVRSSGEVCLIAPALSADQAKRVGIQDVRPWKDGESGVALFDQLADEWDLRRAVLAVDPHLRADHLLDIQATVPSAMFRSAGPTLARVMAQKDAEELARLEAAAAVVDAIFEDLLPTLRAGETERQLAGRIQRMVLERGAGLNFCIVATGPGSAEPHHLPDDTVIQQGDILLLDFGCVLNHYHADITRMVSMGPASTKAKEVYRVVREAHIAARDAVKAGLPCCGVDQAARGEIESAGYGSRFTHRTGHGIGLSGHERPNMSSEETQPLQIGNAFSIEPGIYLPGEFGIRLENIYACGPVGAIAINKKEFEENLLELG